MEMHWVLFSNGFTGNYTYAMIVIPNGYIFASTDSGVFRSIDDGENWSQVNMGLLQIKFLRFFIDKSGYIYAGTDFKGVLLSTDNGDNWTQISSGLTKIWVSSLAINQQGNIFAGTSSGVFRSVNPSSITPVELISFNGSVLNN